jgi:hypothetical protein
MDEIIQALTQLRQNPNNNKYSDEDLISMYGLNRPSFNQGNTGIFSNINFPQINLPKFDNMRNLVTSGIGALARIPGLGFIMNAFTRPNYPSDAMSRSFAVENYEDPYNYNMGSGNLTGKDPFGINTISFAGNYPAYYDKYVRDYEAGKYSPTSQFAIDKYAHGLDVVRKNKERIAKDFANTDAEDDYGAGDYVETVGPVVVADSGNNVFSQRSDKSGATGQNTGGFTNPGKGSYGPHKAEGGRVRYSRGGLTSL